MSTWKKLIVILPFLWLPLRGIPLSSPSSASLSTSSHLICCLASEQGQVFPTNSCTCQILVPLCRQCVLQLPVMICNLWISKSERERETVGHLIVPKSKRDSAIVCSLHRWTQWNTSLIGELTFYRYCAGTRQICARKNSNSNRHPNTVSNQLPSTQPKPKPKPKPKL